MPWNRHLLAVLCAFAVLVAGPLATAASAAEAGDYRAPVSITFPTVQSARYANDFDNGRSGGRVHRSTDLFAAMRSPIYAARGGTVIWLPREQSGLAGFAIQIRGDDGRTYAYYHLGRDGGRFRRAVARSVKLYGHVDRGQLIGWMGDSGNAAGGTPHLHFEIQDNAVTDPYGSNRINPYNSLRKAQGLSLDWSQPKAAAPTGPWALSVGDSGDAVRHWQTKLNRSNRVPDIVADGIFGPGTRAATVTFQQSVNITEGLGVVGYKTRVAMRRLLDRLDGGTAPTPTPKPTPVPSTAPTTQPLLKLGDEGDPVTRWQRKLNRSDRTPNIVADGDFGPATHNATVKFQKSVGLGPAGLGVVGPKTRAAMREVLAAL
jgi:peptidoglycan hydrolase-like protein with peptidoglycan-binding domain